MNKYKLTLHLYLLTAMKKNKLNEISSSSFLSKLSLLITGTQVTLWNNRDEFTPEGNWEFDSLDDYSQKKLIDLHMIMPFLPRCPSLLVYPHLRTELVDKLHDFMSCSSEEIAQVEFTKVENPFIFMDILYFFQVTDYLHTLLYYYFVYHPFDLIKSLNELEGTSIQEQVFAYVVTTEAIPPFQKHEFIFSYLEIYKVEFPISIFERTYGVIPEVHSYTKVLERNGVVNVSLSDYHFASSKGYGELSFRLKGSSYLQPMIYNQMKKDQYALQFLRNLVKFRGLKHVLRLFNQEKFDALHICTNFIDESIIGLDFPYYLTYLFNTEEDDDIEWCLFQAVSCLYLKGMQYIEGVFTRVKELVIMDREDEDEHSKAMNISYCFPNLITIRIENETDIFDVKEMLELPKKLELITVANHEMIDTELLMNMIQEAGLKVQTTHTLNGMIIALTQQKNE